MLNIDIDIDVDNQLNEPHQHQVSLRLKPPHFEHRHHIAIPGNSLLAVNTSRSCSSCFTTLLLPIGHIAIYPWRVAATHVAPGPSLPSPVAPPGHYMRALLASLLTHMAPARMRRPHLLTLLLAAASSGKSGSNSTSKVSLVTLFFQMPQGLRCFSTVSMQ